MMKPKLPDLYRPIETELGEVRAVMESLWRDALQLVQLDDMPGPGVGGKLLRPALCLLSAGAIGGEPLGRYVRLAASFEALHIASLTHDDVIDRALLRRGNASLNALWNNHAAVLGGDYLVARAVEMLAEYDSCPVIANAIGSVRRMAEGELFFFGKEGTTPTQEDCLMLAEQKTASLFAEACSAPAFSINPDYRKPLHAFGTALGIAFQIVDDLLDVSQPASQLGKPSCGDVVEGKQTLPILFLQERLAKTEAERLKGYRGAELTEDDRAWIMAKARETDALARTESLARRHVDAARTELDSLPPSPYRDSMAGLLEFILVRES